MVAGILGCQTSAERPNILIILADDLGYSDIGAYGGEIHTPALDTLAENGVRFRQFYNAGRCCPTRASLLTGRYPHGVGMGAMVSSADSELTQGPYQGYLSESAVTLQKCFRMQATVLMCQGNGMSENAHRTGSVCADSNAISA